MVMIGNDEIESRFGFHKGTDTTGPMHADVRALFIKFNWEMRLSFVRCRQHIRNAFYGSQEHWACGEMVIIES